MTRASLAAALKLTALSPSMMATEKKRTSIETAPARVASPNGQIISARLLESGLVCGWYGCGCLFGIIIDIAAES